MSSICQCIIYEKNQVLHTNIKGTYSKRVSRVTTFRGSQSDQRSLIWEQRTTLVVKCLMMAQLTETSIPWSIFLAVVKTCQISLGVLLVLQLENEKLSKCCVDGHNNSWKVKCKSILISLKKNQDDNPSKSSTALPIVSKFIRQCILILVRDRKMHMIISHCPTWVWLLIRLQWSNHTFIPVLCLSPTYSHLFRLQLIQMFKNKIILLIHFITTLIMIKSKLIFMIIMVCNLKEKSLLPRCNTNHNQRVNLPKAKVHSWVS